MKKIAYLFVAVLLVLFISACVEIDFEDVDEVILNWDASDAYVLDAEVPLSGSELTVVYADGTSEVLSLANENVVLQGAVSYVGESPFLYTGGVGEQTLRVSYGGVSAEASFYVAHYVVTTESPTIQSHIDSASPGNVIYVAAGTYNETLSINKSISLIGANYGVSVGSNPGLRGNETILNDPTPGAETPGIQILYDITGTVVVDGFSLMGYRNTIVSRQGSTSHIANNYIIPETGYLRNGIQVAGNGSIIENNYITGFPLTDYWASTAIHLTTYPKNQENWVVENITIRGNYVDGSADLAIALADYEGGNIFQNITIEDNKTDNSGVALRLSGLSYYYVDGGQYVELGGTKEAGLINNITITNNDFNGNIDDTSNHIGIHFSIGDITNVVATGNIMTNMVDEFSIGEYADLVSVTLDGVPLG